MFNSKPPFGKDNAAPEMSAEQKKKILTDMIRIRRFEERAVQSYQKGKIGGFCHTYIGQESVAVGIASVLTPEDHMVSAYRIHGQALAMGMTMNECMAEMYGKYTGCSKGKGGSMHFFDPAKRFWGGHGIVGGQTPLGLGMAYAQKYMGKKGATICFLGDGASDQGAFFESMNMAALWSIPVIYVIENNGYSMGTAQSRHSAGANLHSRGAPFGMANEMVEGNDIHAVRAAMAKALKLAHETGKPSLLEMKTYRYRGHSMSDPDQTYRTKDEIKKMMETNDPIDRWKAILIKEKVITEADFEKIDHAAKDEAEASATFAEESPFPPPSDILTDVYVDASLAQKY